MMQLTKQRVLRLLRVWEYGDFLEEMLRDRLVWGRNHERTEQKLLSEGASLANSAKNVRYWPVGGICNSASGSYIKQKSERDGLKVNKQKTLFYVSSVQGNTVPSSVHLSINNVFTVKTKDTLKNCIERKLLKKMFQHIHRILLTN